MKRILTFLCTFLFLVALSSCAMIPQQEEYLGFSKQDFTVVAEEDTHGGFHGDGSYYLILDCSNNIETASENINGWKPLPLSENLELIMYGGQKDGVYYGYGLSEEAHMPKIINGYYFFQDRHAKSVDPSDDSSLFDQFSFNFTLAVYDCDTNRFYYFKFDT